jgi:hypothetical protein
MVWIRPPTLLIFDCGRVLFGSRVNSALSGSDPLPGINKGDLVCLGVMGLFMMGACFGGSGEKHVSRDVRCQAWVTEGVHRHPAVSETVTVPLSGRYSATRSGDI